ncbi:hypothetical protein ACI65C_013331 [Semiaphis heraclei]
MESTSGVVTSSDSGPSSNVPNATTCLVRGQPQQVVLLSTALVEVYAADGRRHVVRALLDCGSQASFITEKTCCALMPRRYHSPVSVTTFANTASTFVRGKCNINIVPCGQQSPSFSLDVSIIPQVTGQTPQSPILAGKWTHIEHLPLADPSYNIPGVIDLLLGADLLPSIYLDGQFGEPLAMNTVFGWVLLGPMKPSDQTVAEDDRAMSPSVILDSSEHSDLKVLGLKWDPVADTSSFKHEGKKNELQNMVSRNTFTSISPNSKVNSWLKKSFADSTRQVDDVQHNYTQNTLSINKTVKLPKRKLLYYDDEYNIKDLIKTNFFKTTQQKVFSYKSGMKTVGVSATYTDNITRKQVLKKNVDLSKLNEVPELQSLNHVSIQKQNDVRKLMKFFTIPSEAEQFYTNIFKETTTVDDVNDNIEYNEDDV